MKRFITTAVCALAFGMTGLIATVVIAPLRAESSANPVATTRTATFTIENMTCALCPVTVKSAMERVGGVQSVEIDFDAKTATVVFNPSVTGIAAIAGASTNAGYPATVSSRAHE